MHRRFFQSDRQDTAEPAYPLRQSYKQVFIYFAGKTLFAPDKPLSRSIKRVHRIYCFQNLQYDFNPKFEYSGELTSIQNPGTSRFSAWIYAAVLSMMNCHTRNSLNKTCWVMPVPEHWKAIDNPEIYQAFKQ